MSNIEEQNLTEFLLEVKAKMANITLSENEAINEITSYVLSNTGKFIRSKIKKKIPQSSSYRGRVWP